MIINTGQRTDMGWRYAPVFISDAYPEERHIQAFEYMARALSDSTHTVVVSFIDLYEKTKQWYPQTNSIYRNPDE